MSPLLSLPAALTFALALIAKATLVLALAGLAAGLLRRRGASAASRHLLWTVAVAVLLALPLLSLALPAWRVAVLPAAAAAAPAPALDLTAAEPPAVLSPAAGGTLAMPSAGPTAADGAGLALLLPLLYLAGVLAVIGRVALGHWSVARLARRATPVSDPEWNALLRDLSWMMAVPRPVRLLRGGAATMPMTWGALQGSVLLPAEAESWCEERRRVVLLHELAHVARYDCLTQTLAAVACALYWFHPGAWYAARRLRVERELACDDRVLAAGTRAREYASHLLEVARAFRPDALAGPVAVSMARPSQLEGRLLAVLDALRERRPPTPRAAALGTLAALLVVIPLASLRPASAQADRVGSSAAPARHFPVRTAASSGRAAPPEPVRGRAAQGGYDRVFEARPGERLTLVLSPSLGARVEAWQRAGVHLRVEDPALRVSATRVAGGVRVEVSGRTRHDAAEPEVRIQVPARFDVDARADNGGLEIRGLTGTFSGSTRGGGLAFVHARGTVRMDGGGGGAYVSHSRLDGRLELRGGGALVDDNQGNLRITGSAGVVRGSVAELSEWAGRISAAHARGDIPALYPGQEGAGVIHAEPDGAASIDLRGATAIAASAPRIASRALSTATAALAEAAIAAEGPGAWSIARADGSQSLAVVSGRVRDAAGNPVTGVLVRITELGVGTTPREDGRYRLVVPAPRLEGHGTSFLVSVLRERVLLAQRRVELRAGESATLDFQLGGRGDSGSGESYSVSDASGSALISGDVPGRVASVWAMARNAPPVAAAQGLGRLAFADPDERVERAAVAALREIGGEEAEAALARIATEHPNQNIRREARATIP